MYLGFAICGCLQTFGTCRYSQTCHATMTFTVVQQSKQVHLGRLPYRKWPRSLHVRHSQVAPTLRGPGWISMYHNDSKARRSLLIPNLEECQCTDLFLGHRCGEEHVRLSFRHLNGVGGDCQRWYYCSLKPLCSSKLSNRPRATDNAGRCRCVQSLR